MKDTKDRVSQAFRLAILLCIATSLAAGVIVSVLQLPPLLYEFWVADPSLVLARRADLVVRIGQTTALSVGGVLAIFGVVLSFSRHHEEIASHRRDQKRLDAEKERELRSRYVSAVELLSDADRPIKRTAGLHALGALADDWQNAGRADEVQVCVNTICDYLRQPPSLDRNQFPIPTPPPEIGVRTTGWTIIRQHLQSSNEHSWSDLEVNLSRAHLDYVADLSELHMWGSGRLDLSRCRFEKEGRLDLSGATVSGEASLDLERIDLDYGGYLVISGLRVLNGGKFSLSDFAVSYGDLFFENVEIDDSGTFAISKAQFSQMSALWFPGLTLSGGGVAEVSDVTFNQESKFQILESAITDSSRLLLSDITVLGKGELRLQDVSINTGGSLKLPHLKLFGESQFELLDVAVSSGSCLNLAGVNLNSKQRLKFSNILVNDGGVLDLSGITALGVAVLSAAEVAVNGSGCVIISPDPSGDSDPKYDYGPGW